MASIGKENSEKVDKNVEDCFILVSLDKKEYPISEKAIQQSKTLAQLISSLNISKSSEHRKIPVENVLGEHLELIVEWCEHHKNSPIREDKADSAQKTEITEWDRKFLSFDNDTMFYIICAANFLDIEPLIDITCRTVAAMAQGRTPEELRVIFGITSDEEDQDLMMQAPQVEIVEVKKED